MAQAPRGTGRRGRTPLREPIDLYLLFKGAVEKILGFEILNVYGNYEGLVHILLDVKMENGRITNLEELYEEYGLHYYAENVNGNENVNEIENIEERVNELNINDNEDEKGLENDEYGIDYQDNDEPDQENEREYSLNTEDNDGDTPMQ